MLCKKDAHNKKRTKRKSNGRDSIFRILLLVRTNETRAKTGFFVKVTRNEYPSELYHALFFSSLRYSHQEDTAGGIICQAPFASGTAAGRG